MSQPPTTRNDRPQAVRQQTLNASVAISQSPWPPPDIIERYETISPGSAERLIRLVEQEAEHRRALELRQPQFAPWPFSLERIPPFMELNGRAL